MQKKLIDVCQEWKDRKGESLDSPFWTVSKGIPKVLTDFDLDDLVNDIKHYLISRGIGKEVVEKL